MARPTDYSSELTDIICERIADGESLRTICLSDDMPNKATVFRWLAKHEEFSDQYARAREEQGESHADDIVNIADNEPDVQRAKLMIDARKWTASKLKPKKYGDKITQDVTVQGAVELTRSVLEVPESGED